jgi:nucleoside-diphosphate-sugar epimerase
VRGSDYLGGQLGDNAHVPRVIPAALQGRTVRVVGSADQPHTWTDVVDMGRALVAVSDNDHTLGRVWHAPSNPPRTQAEAVNDVLASVGKPPVSVKAYPRLALRAAGLFDGQLRELRETEYQFTRPYVMDSSAITAELGLAPTPWDETCRRTAG